MRTETRTYEVYNLHELTREAQAKAHSHWAEHFDYGWADENEKTLQAFEQTFNIKVDRWSYDSYTYWYRFTSHYSEEEDNLKGVRLLNTLSITIGMICIYPKPFGDTITRQNARAVCLFRTIVC